MMKKLLSILLLIISLPEISSAQQDPMYSMYMFNGLVLNPAYAGSRHALSATMIGRKQWMGLAGAPTSSAISIHAPSTDLKNGFGLILSGDRAGFTDNYTFLPSYAFRIPVGEEGALALGVQLGVNAYKVRLSDVATQQSGDQAFSGQDFSRLHALAGSGIYFHTQRFYAGVSVPNFIPSRLYDKDNLDGVSQKVTHVFATSGFVLDVGDHLKIKPSALLKWVPGIAPSLDVNLSLLLEETVWVGGSWRPGTGFAFLGEVNVKKNFRVGYAYDMMTNGLSSYSGGTHELMLGFDFQFEKSNMASPRFF